MTRPDLLVATRRTADEAVVELVGDLDISTASRLGRAVDGVLSSQAPSQVLLDLGGVTFCDSHGLSVLVLVSRRLTLAHSKLVLVNAPDSLLRILRVTGLREALSVRETGLPPRLG